MMVHLLVYENFQDGVVAAFSSEEKALQACEFCKREGGDYWVNSLEVDAVPSWLQTLLNGEHD